MVEYPGPPAPEQPPRAAAEVFRWLASLAGTAPAFDTPKAAVQLLTTREVAAILRVSPSRVRKLHRQGRLRAHPDFPTKLLFRAGDVAAFLKGQ